MLAIRNPGLLQRDSLKMCWTVAPLAEYPLPNPYRLVDITNECPLDQWIQTMTAAGMPVRERTWQREVIEHPPAQALGIFFEGSLVAAAILRPIVDAADGAHLMWVGVTPAHQGRKLGRVLVAAMMRAALGRYATVYLLTDDERRAAISLYLSLGFRPCLNSWDRTHHLRWKRIGRSLARQLDYCRVPGHRHGIANMVR
jgi:GNAT superfamily N-acetyltransferase